jgi:hypothetical protein
MMVPIKKEAVLLRTTPNICQAPRLWLEKHLTERHLVGTAIGFHSLDPAISLILNWSTTPFLNCLADKNIVRKPIFD